MGVNKYIMKLGFLSRDSWPASRLKLERRRELKHNRARRSREREIKRRSCETTPSRRNALLFIACARDFKVSLLAGYVIVGENTAQVNYQAEKSRANNRIVLV